MEARIVELWSSVLGRPVAPGANLFTDLSADSVQVLEMLEVVADECGVLVSVDELLGAPTAREFARVVAEQL